MLKPPCHFMLIFLYGAIQKEAGSNNTDNNIKNIRLKTNYSG